MSYESSIHEAQTLILRHLLFVPSASFASLQKQTKLTSDHFNFHIKKLVDEGLIEKTGSQYALTNRGKEYANRLDTDENEIERQPKVSVALIIERINDGKREFLSQQRLKQPYYGFWGRPSGKVRWGESLEYTAQRELMEETGLDGDFEYRTTFRKRDYSESTKQLLEDKLFFVMYCNNASGTLIAEFEGGRNQWMTQEEFVKQDKTFESARNFVNLLDAGTTYYAKEYTYSDDEY